MPPYVTDLLTQPVNALSVTVNAPNDATLYGSFAGKPVGFVALACYPTTASNPRADYSLPTGQIVPHMQTGAEAPLFADDSARYPVIAFSHGFAGSPLSDEHLVVLAWLASYGYVVIAPFHGDPRFTDLQIDDFGDAVAALSRLDDAVAMQARCRSRRRWTWCWPIRNGVTMSMPRRSVASVRASAAKP